MSHRSAEGLPYPQYQRDLSPQVFLWGSMKLSDTDIELPFFFFLFQQEEKKMSAAWQFFDLRKAMCQLAVLRVGREVKMLPKSSQKQNKSRREAREEKLLLKLFFCGVIIET